MKYKIAVIGAGNMGEAIIKGLNLKGIIASDKRKNKIVALKRRYKIKIAKNNTEAIKKTNVVILAIKPQDMDVVIKDIAEEITGEQLIISIVAGITTKKIEKSIGKKIAVIRVMPNTPLLVGEGMSVLCRGNYAKTRHVQLVEKIFCRMGKVLVVKNEKLIDAVTAISGSGPAYVYLFIESLIKAANSMGLSKISKELVMQTFRGAIKLLEESKRTPEELRKKVTSPGGTTEAALKIFSKKKFKEIINSAVKAASERSNRLSK